MFHERMKEGVRVPSHICIGKLTGEDRGEFRQTRQEVATVPQTVHNDGWVQHGTVMLTKETAQTCISLPCAVEFGTMNIQW